MISALAFGGKQNNKQNRRQLNTSAPVPEKFTVINYIKVANVTRRLDAHEINSSRHDMLVTAAQEQSASEIAYLLRGHAREAEHADLRGNVLPVAGGASLLIEYDVTKH